MARSQKEARKQERIVLRNLIKKYDIEFRGPLTPNDWPKLCQDIFMEVRSIGFLEYDKLEPNENTNQDEIDEMKRRADEIVERAYRDRREMVNESTLRSNHEHLIFTRFDARLKCPRCLNFLWRTVSKALPSDPLEAKKLLKRDSERAMCECPPNSRNYELDTSGRRFLFKGDDDVFVYCDPNDPDEIQRRKRKPDKLFGLSMTDSLAHLCDLEPVRDLRHSPVGEKNILYPFLIVEAKSEVGAFGFESIEAQTAFPIRTCLKLQEDLKRRTNPNFPMNPLLWFLSYVGDEWRIAACIINQNKYQVIDLWMGRTTSKDGALQLLYQIDFICKWARDVFRFEILQCLAGGREQLRHVSPTYASRFSTQESEHASIYTVLSNHTDPVNDVSGRTSPGSSEKAAFTFSEAETLANLAMNDDMETRRSPESPVDTPPHPFLKWTGTSLSRAPWARHVTARHANMIVFAFCHLSLPEDDYALIMYLENLSRLTGHEIAVVVSNLIWAFCDAKGSVCIKSGQIQQLKSAWIRDGNGASGRSELLVRVRFGFYSYLRVSDWLITRELWCISCSMKAFLGLLTIANMTDDERQTQRRWFSYEQSVPTSVLNPLRGLTRLQSALAAFNSILLDMCVKEEGDGNYEYHWIENPKMQTSVASSLLTPRLYDKGAIASMVDRVTTVIEAIGKPLPRSLQSIIGDQTPRIRVGMILCKGSHWPQSTPQWCLLVFDEVDFEDKRELGRILKKAIEGDRFYAFAFSESYEEPGNLIAKQIDGNIDKHFLDLWANDMLA